MTAFVSDRTSPTKLFSTSSMFRFRLTTACIFLERGALFVPQDRFQDGQVFPHVIVYYRVQQIILRLEVVVERALRQAYLLHNVAHRHLLEAFFPEQLVGGNDKLLPSYFRSLEDTLLPISYLL